MHRKSKPYQRDFNLVVAGQVISIFGSALLRFALSLYVLDATGSESTFAAMLALSSVPLLLSPLGGAIADRFNRRNLMVVFDSTSSLIVLSLFIFMITGHATVTLIGVVMVLLSAVSAMYFPTVTASIPQLVSDENLAGANGVVQAVRAISNIAAPICGGILYGVFGVRMLVVVTAAAFFISAVMETFIRIPFTRREMKEHIVPTIMKDMKAGFSYVIKHALIRKTAVIGMLLNLILTPLMIVGTPIILRITMQSTDMMYGIGMGMVSFAMILGALLMGVVGKKLHVRRTYLLIGAIVVMLIPVAFSTLPYFFELGYFLRFTLFMIGMFPMAAILSIMDIFIITKIQMATPNENLGKVMAIIMAAVQFAAPLGQIVYGVAFETFSGTLYIPIAAVGAVMLAVTFLSQRMLRGESG